MLTLIPVFVVSLTVLASCATVYALILRKKSAGNAPIFAFLGVIAMYFFLKVLFTAVFFLREMMAMQTVTTLINVMAMLMPAFIYFAAAHRVGAPVATPRMLLGFLILCYAALIYALTITLDNSITLRITIMHTVQFYFYAKIVTTLRRHESMWTSADSLMYRSVIFAIVAFVVCIIVTVINKNWPMYYLAMFVILNCLTVMFLRVMHRLARELGAAGV